MPVEDFTVESATQLALDLRLDELEDAERQFASVEDAQRISEDARAVFEREHLWADEVYEGYLTLREAGWPWRVACWIAWSSVPKERRLPPTQQELATQVLGLTSDRTIRQWRAKNPAIDEAVAKLVSATLFRHRAAVFEALVKVASMDEPKAFRDRELLLKITKDYVPGQRVELDVGSSEPVEMDADELAQIARQAATEDDG